MGGNCDIEAYYLGEARHAFYSLDEAGHLQVRAPMVYLNQIFASFENATIKELEVRFTSINNAHCNADPSYTKLDAPLSGNVHMTTCKWNTDKGATIPTTDDPLMTGTAEQAFYDGDHATVGPFTDLTVPANPFTVTPTQWG